MKWNEFSTMKKVESMTLVLGFLLVVGTSSVQAEQPCNLTTLNGSYAFTNTGFALGDPKLFSGGIVIRGNLQIDGAIDLSRNTTEGLLSFVQRS